MSNESIIAWLNSRAIEDSYLYELLAESQIRYGDNLLGISKKVMDKKRFLDLLRFADIPVSYTHLTLPTICSV